VQLDPIRPVLKAPGTKRLKPKFDQLHSILPHFAFNFSLRRYSKAEKNKRNQERAEKIEIRRIEVGRCRLTL